MIYQDILQTIGNTPLVRIRKLNPNPDVIDETVMVETEDAFKMARRIIKEEGIFVGMSSGAAMLAACETAKKIKSGIIVVIFPDRGEKYLTTDLFSENSRS